MYKNAKIFPALLLGLALVACGSTMPTSSSAAASSAPSTPASGTAASAPAKEPTPAPTPDTFGASYTLTAAEPTLGNGYGSTDEPVPDKTVPLYLRSDVPFISWAEAAELSGRPEDTLRALNPDVREEDGKLQADMYGYPDDVYDLLIEEAYELPHTACLQVKIDLPANEEDGGAYLVPAALEERAAITLAEGLEFLHHLSSGQGYNPSEEVEGREMEGLNRALPGARFTTWADFKAYLDSLFTPKFAAQFMEELESGFMPWYQEGDNGELWFIFWEHGYAMDYLGMTYTEPQTQPDGSLTFGLLSLNADEHLDAWLQDEISSAEALDRAYYIPVRLVPDGAGGWRVDELNVPD